MGKNTGLSADFVEGSKQRNRKLNEMLQQNHRKQIDEINRYYDEELQKRNQTDKQFLMLMLALATLGIAASEKGRADFKARIWNPLCDKYNAIKRNGLKELFTKRILCAAALCGGAYLGYRWYSSTSKECT